MTPTISAVIPAYNEEKTIAGIIEGALSHADEVVVVDDGSKDQTSQVAVRAGARVVKLETNQGVLTALKTGFQAAKGDIIVTLDADGQHNPAEIPKLLGPILAGQADLVIGKRPTMPYLSERIITAIVNLRIPCQDASSGFRAMRSSIAKRLTLPGTCPCGTLIIEAYRLGAVIKYTPITIQPREGKRRIKTNHLHQTLVVIRELIIKREYKEGFSLRG